MRRREELLAEEERVERDSFSQRHADDGLDEDLARRTWIAADAFDGLGADQTDTNGRREATESALDAAAYFSDDGDHVILLCCWLDCRRAHAWHAPGGKGSMRVFAVAVGGVVRLVAVIADQPDVDAD